MSDRSSQMLALYQTLIDKVKVDFGDNNQLSTKDLMASVTKGTDYLKLKQIADSEELALVEHFLKRDIIAFLNEQHADELSYSPTMIAMENTFWHWLSEITDRSQVEWHELSQDFKQHGEYQSGDIISQGTLTCIHCGHKMHIEFTGLIPDCPQCEQSEFIREALTP
ncbi:MAG: zinc ribbon-containing protein [Shewanella sp.]|uniref:zinc ribbon-containing protein n=1 Tax=Shewanella sp. SNU WT4 TaxID=2590015 RepID=UPI0011285536|nr:zinc ribbon-containing protein [Shewanella sp. SNU WT4]QDF67931.1 hypothetical protein FJQ87_15750 [Shewanella sp. SNU WT4]